MFSSKEYKTAAFLLHQATEHFFNCSLLTLTDYKPKTHNLDILNKLCSSQNHQFLTIFPTATEEQKNCFNLLNSAYIDARYEESYTISKEQLEYLIERVEILKEITKKTCEEKIESFVWGFVGATLVVALLLFGRNASAPTKPCVGEHFKKGKHKARPYKTHIYKI